jgi:hypothetical protein
MFPSGYDVNVAPARERQGQRAQPRLLRTAVEEHIRMGPQSCRPVAQRLARRARGASAAELASALRRAGRAVAAAEALAREYQDGKRAQADCVAELRRRFPWLDDAGAGKAGDLAVRLADFGYFLVIM